MNYKVVYLEECCEILDNKRVPITAKDRKEGIYPYYGANGIQGYIDQYIFDDELVLLAEDGGHFEDKKKPIAYRVSGKCWVNNHAHVLKPLDCIDVDYLCYSLMFYNVDGIINGATRKKLTQSAMRKMKIYLVNLDTQKTIVQHLKCIEKIIELRRQQLVDFDVFVKSQFVEMFGDPMINPKGWQEIKISEIVDGKVSNGFFAKRNEYVDDGNVAVLGVSNVVNRMYSQCQNLPKANGTDRDIEKYGLKYGDMLFCRSSLVVEGIGKASIVPQNVPEHTLFECHVIRLPLDLSKCVPEFIQVLTTTNYFRTQIISQAKTSTMTTIGQDGILKSNIILPPLDIQNTFLTFVQQVDKSKFSCIMK